MINNNKVKDISKLPLTNNILLWKRQSYISSTGIFYRNITTFNPKGCYKIAKERLPLLDIISGIDDATKNISTAYMANSFRLECSNVLNKERAKSQKRFNEKSSNDI